MIVVIALQSIIVLSILWAGRRRTEDALPVFCFFLTLMPLESRLVIPGLFDFNTMRLSLLTLLFLFAMKRRPSNPSPIPLKSLMLLHIGWVLVSTAFSISVATSVKQLISQVLEYYLMYFLVVRSITGEKTIYRILYRMMMAMSLCCVFALLEAYAQYSILRIFPHNLWITYNGGLDPLYIEWGRGLRVRSTFPHPILFGDALAMSIPVTLYLLSVWEKRSQRAILWLSLLLMTWAIYKTSSRGPWLACGLCGALLFLMVRNRVRKYLVTVAVMMVIAAVSRPGIWQTVVGLYVSSTDATSPVGSSYLFRHVLTQTIDRAVQAAPHRFILGYGIGTFREKGLDIDFLGVLQRWYTCDDNWACFEYETGYGGLAIMVLLLFKPLLIALRDYRKLPRPGNALSGVLFISLSGFYFLLISVAGYSWGQQGYMAWILISLVVSHRRVAGQASGSEPFPSPIEVERDYVLHTA